MFVNNIYFISLAVYLIFSKVRSTSESVKANLSNENLVIISQYMKGKIETDEVEKTITLTKIVGILLHNV